MPWEFWVTERMWGMMSEDLEMTLLSLWYLIDIQPWSYHVTFQILFLICNLVDNNCYLPLRVIVRIKWEKYTEEYYYLQMTLQILVINIPWKSTGFINTESSLKNPNCWNSWNISYHKINLINEKIIIVILITMKLITLVLYTLKVKRIVVEALILLFKANHEKLQVQISLWDWQI